MKRYYKNLRILQLTIVLIVFIIPLVLLLSRSPVPQDIQDYVYLFARIFAITGILTFSVNLFLAGRYKFMDRFVGGLEKLFRVHRLTGKIAYVLITLHITFITLYYFLFNLDIGIDFLFATDIPTLIGKIAFSILTIILIITLYVKMKYEYKHFIHKFLGLVVLLGLVHGIAEMTDLSTNPLLSIYVPTVVNIGLLSYLTRNIFRRFFVRKYKYKVVKNELINKDVNQIKLEPLGDNIKHKPGQFVFVNFIQNNIPNERHPFSLTSHPSEDYLMINPKISGDFTRIIPEINDGTVCFVEGPYGGFNYDKLNTQKQIWIAGGIGITPFISMFKEYKRNQDIELTLVHSISRVQDAIKSDQFKALSNSSDKFNYVQWITEDKGHITIDKVSEITSIDNAGFMLCGPEPMTNALRDQLRDHNIDNLRVQYELFKML